MSRRTTEEILRRNPKFAAQIDEAKAAGARGASADGRPKYGNIPTADSQGRVHPSRLQARVTDRLRLEGAVAVIPEISMPLSVRPNDRIRIDALAILKIDENGFFLGRFVEIKGMDLPAGIQKRRRFEDAYGVKILVIKK